MSASLAKEAIELFNDDLDDKDGKICTKKKNGKLKNNGKVGKKKQSSRQRKVHLSSTAFDEEWRYKNVDRTQQNLQFMKDQQKYCTVDRKLAEVIIEHHKKKKRPRVREKRTVTASQQSVFTDRDFHKFSKEYVFK